MAKVGSISAGRKRELLVRMDYQAPQGKAMALGAFTLRFKDTLAEGRPREIVVRPEVTVTTDPKKVEASEDFAVSVRAVEFEAAAAMQLASEAVDQGRFDDARSMLQSQQEVLEQRAKEHPELEVDDIVKELGDAERKIDDAKQSLEQRKLYKKSFKSKAYKRRKK